jgi:hypothetical protein
MLTKIEQLEKNVRDTKADHDATQNAENAAYAAYIKARQLLRQEQVTYPKEQQCHE